MSFRDQRERLYQRIQESRWWPKFRLRIQFDYRHVESFLLPKIMFDVIKREICPNVDEQTLAESGPLSCPLLSGSSMYNPMKFGRCDTGRRSQFTT